MSKPTLYGFNGSTYVRTVRMLLHEKGAEYEQVPVNVLEREPQQPEHLARHPFGKVPVFDHEGLRLIETGAICRYIDAGFEGPSLIPVDLKDRARMDMTMNLIDAYGYSALLNVAGFHLFPDFLGGENEAARQEGVQNSMKLLDYLMQLRGDDPFIAGTERSLADFYLAPLCAYVDMTEDAERVFKVAGFAHWWEQARTLPSFRATPPDT